MASEAADCRHTYTIANCPQRRLEKPEREKRKENEKKRRKELEKTRAGRFRKRRVLFCNADQEAKTRMRNNALRTGPRQAVE
ncbi:hypothetical protein TNCV_418171 [Trichonephila clavipes]|nr:hypothetical protein TNCV_418171 [Trichonephila clavipes]